MVAIVSVIEIYFVGLLLLALFLMMFLCLNIIVDSVSVSVVVAVLFACIADFVVVTLGLRALVFHPSCGCSCFGQCCVYHWPFSLFFLHLINPLPPPHPQQKKEICSMNLQTVSKSPV